MSKNMMSLLLPICLGLGACGESETPSKQPSELQNQMKADADLMLDIGRAGTELERRLSETVRAQDGIIIIHSPVTGRFMSQVLSPNAPWVLSCLRMGDTAFLGRPWLAGPPGAGLRLIRDYGEIERLIATIDVERRPSK